MREHKAGDVLVQAMFAALFIERHANASHYNHVMFHEKKIRILHPGRVSLIPFKRTVVTRKRNVWGGGVIT